jgi:hypothetical protein
MSGVFRLREDMPPEFRRSTVYRELPAALNFLGQYVGRKFESEGDFQRALDEFPAYLAREKVPPSPDKALGAGLLLNSTSSEGVSDVIARSDKKGCPYYWFGSFGPPNRLDRYFAEKKAARSVPVLTFAEEEFG